MTAEVLLSLFFFFHKLSCLMSPLLCRRWLVGVAFQLVCAAFVCCCCVVASVCSLFLHRSSFLIVAVFEDAL